MDDSPEREGEAVVFQLKDSRVVYSPNSKRLGGAANLDNAFVSKSVLGGDWACVLEDDNWLMPSFLALNIRALDTHGVGILMRNQQVSVQLRDRSYSTERTTRGGWFMEQRYEPLDLYAFLFLFEGISNGGLFWHTSIRSNLHVGPDVEDSGLQEYCRTLQITEPAYFESEPLCFWSEMPEELISRSSIGSRLRSRGIQSISQWLIRNYGNSVISRASVLAESLSRTRQFETALTDALYSDHDFRFLTGAERLRRYARSYAKHRLIKDPLKNYLARFRVWTKVDE